MTQKIQLRLSTKGQYFVLVTHVKPEHMDPAVRKAVTSSPHPYYQIHRTGRDTTGEWKIMLNLDWYKNVQGILGDRLEISPEVVERVDKIEREAFEAEQIKAGRLKLTLPPNLPLVTKPYFHQEQALALVLKRDRFGLFMDMGTGKTKVILDLCACLKKSALDQKTEFNPFLVICPVSVLEVWARQGLVHQPSLRIHVLAGSSIVKGRTYYDLRKANATDMVVVSYESAWRIRELLEFPFTAIVLDEATKIKTRTSKQSKGTIQLAKATNRRYILTGTPMPNSPLEVWNQIRFLDPLIFGHSFYLFRDTYALMGGFQNHEVVGWKNLDQLSRKLAGISYMVKKADCLDLPPKVYQDYRLDMDSRWGVAYATMAKDLVAEIQGTTISVEALLAKLTKLRQMASGFVYAPGTEELVLRCEYTQNPKVVQLAELLVDWLPQGHKCVIWGTFREELNLIEKVLGEIVKPGQWVRLDGSVPQEKRAELVEKFQTDPNCKVFVGQQRAGGLGITLTAASYCVFFSNDYSPEIRLQCEDRLHRIGQTSSVTYVDLIVRKSIDVAIYKMLKDKQKLTAIVERHGLKGVVNGDEKINDWKAGPEGGTVGLDGAGDQLYHGSSREAERDQNKVGGGIAGSDAV